MVSSAGYQIAEMCSNNPILKQKFASERIKVAMLVGESHRDLIRKFTELGVSVSFSSPGGRTSDNPANQKIEKWLSQGYIDTQELEEVSRE